MENFLVWRIKRIVKFLTFAVTKIIGEANEFLEEKI